VPAEVPIHTHTRRSVQAFSRYNSALLDSESGTTRAMAFQIHRESSILLHPLAILPRNPHI
jgi:hypothetical protein